MKNKKPIIFDNPATFDRFTVFAGDGGVYGMSENPFSPLGFNMFVGEDARFTPWGTRGDILPGAHLGKRVKLESLPEEVQRAITERITSEE